MNLSVYMSGGVCHPLLIAPSRSTNIGVYKTLWFNGIVTRHTGLVSHVLCVGHVERERYCSSENFTIYTTNNSNHLIGQLLTVAAT